MCVSQSWERLCGEGGQILGTKEGLVPLVWRHPAPHRIFSVSLTFQGRKLRHEETEASGVCLVTEEVLGWSSGPV